LKKGISDILSASKDVGWVLEPQAKRLFSMAGLGVPRFTMSITVEEAVRFAHEIGYPIVAKVVSPRIVHKSDRDGVAVGIDSDGELTETEMMSGVELMVGAKIDYQFGPVILLGVGGTGVEIYRDIALRMAPLREKDVESMVKGLKASRLLEGYRG
jgi:acyl-CoA synthetase (NDP forming)